MSPAPFDLKGRNAVLVTRDGINAPALASALTDAGATLAVVHPESATPPQTPNTVPWPGGTDGLDAAVSSAISGLGGIDILVNDLAADFAKPLADMTYAEWRATIDLNLDSVFLSCKAASTHMLAQQRGRVVNIASGLGARVVVNQSAFSAAQAGVIHLTRALGLEWARDNVRVNAIVGGWIVDSDDALPDKIRRYVPMQRWGRPEDLGGTLVYLASDSCAFTTGEPIFIDGGIMIRT